MVQISLGFSTFVKFKGKHATRKISIILLVSLAEQVGLSLNWSQNLEGWFSCDEVHL